MPDKCLQCLIELKLAAQEGNGGPGPDPEDANDAITLAPSQPYAVALPASSSVRTRARSGP